MNLRQLVIQLGGWDEVLANGQYSIQMEYFKLIGPISRVPRAHVLTKCAATPIAKFYVWLATLQRLPIRDRLMKWGLDVDGIFPLCYTAKESHQHLFLECSWVKQLRRVVFEKFEDNPELLLF